MTSQDWTGRFDRDSPPAATHLDSAARISQRERRRVSLALGQSEQACATIWQVTSGLRQSDARHVSVGASPKKQKAEK